MESKSDRNADIPDDFYHYNFHSCAFTVAM